MTSELEISANWERLERGTPEDRVSFAAVGVRYGNIWLTEAEDAFVNRLRTQVHLSAYRLAEWFAWNWWRLRSEPRTQAPDWVFAHHMTTIGGGLCLAESHDLFRWRKDRLAGQADQIRRTRTDPLPR